MRYIAKYTHPAGKNKRNRMNKHRSNEQNIKHGKLSASTSQALQQTSSTFASKQT